MIRTCIKLKKHATADVINKAITKLCGIDARGRDDMQRNNFLRVSVGGVMGIKVEDGPDFLSCIYHPTRCLYMEFPASPSFDRVKWLSWIVSMASEDANLALLSKPLEYDERIGRVLTKNILKCSSALYLPVVFVMADANWTFPIDPWSISSALFCQAHVVSVFSPEDAAYLRSVLHMPSNSSVVIVSPGGSIKFLSEADVHNVVPITERLASHLSMQFTLSDYPTTWDGLLMKKLQLCAVLPKNDDVEPDEVCKEVSDEDDSEHLELLRMADYESTKWREKFLESDQRCRALASELECLKQSQKISGRGILSYGKEQDYYLDEVKDTLLSALAEIAPVSHGRKKDILLDIIEANPATGTRDSLIREIGDIFMKDNCPTERMRNSLKKCGFDYEEASKHPKIIWNNDERYMKVLSKTPSDNYAQEAAKKEILRKLFGI